MLFLFKKIFIFFEPFLNLFRISKCKDKIQYNSINVKDRIKNCRIVQTYGTIINDYTKEGERDYEMPKMWKRSGSRI